MIKRTWQIEAMGETHNFEAYEDPQQPGMYAFAITTKHGVDVHGGYYTPRAARRAMDRYLHRFSRENVAAAGVVKEAKVIA